MEPKFKPGDRVAFLWEAMELHHGTVSKFHGGDKPIYSVEEAVPDPMSRLFGQAYATRFLYESEMTLDIEAKSANA
jgi:hypothetical protein